MSALLLDTHIWLWYAEGDGERLRPASVRKLDDARKSEGLVVSAISVWEIGMHAARGRIQLAVPLRDWVGRALGFPGILGGVEYLAGPTSPFALGTQGLTGGPMSAQFWGATPRGTVAILYTYGGGGPSTVPAGNPCAGTLINLNAARLPLVA